MKTSLAVAGVAGALVLSGLSCLHAEPERVKFPPTDLVGYTTYALLKTAAVLKPNDEVPSAGDIRTKKVADAMAGSPTGDSVRGLKLFKRCKACHLADNSGKHRIGPNLFGIVGAKIAAVKGYKYTKALKAHGDKTWDASALDKWLTKPRAFAKGTKMSFPGFKKPKDRADVIAYLSGLK